jgi:hypothetical protein
MLEAVVENKEIPQAFAFCQSAGFISISANDDRGSRRSPRNQEWFITGLLPPDDWSIAAADNQDSLAGSFVSSRENHRTKPVISKALRQRNDQRRLTRPTKRKVADADDRMIQSQSSKQSGFIHFFSRAEQESEYAAHRLLLRGNAAPLFNQGADCLETGKRLADVRCRYIGIANWIGCLH